MTHPSLIVNLQKLPTIGIIIMTSSYYPITTDNFFDNKQSQSIPPTSHYSSYQMTTTTTNEHYSDDEDDDLDALRNAALKTLNSKKRKNTYDHSPTHGNSRSSSQSSYTYSSISRSYSSSSLSSISSDSIDNHDKDYRFETKVKQSTGDIDERFPQDIPTDNDDMLIVNCPIQDDDLLLHNEEKSSKKQIVPSSSSSSKQTSDRNERNHRPSSTKEVKVRKEERKKSPPIERPVSITVKLNSDEFDLRQLIKKRRTDESAPNNHRVVQILPKDDHTTIVHKPIHGRLSSGRTEKNRTSHKH